MDIVNYFEFGELLVVAHVLFIGIAASCLSPNPNSKTIKGNTKRIFEEMFLWQK